MAILTFQMGQVSVLPKRFCFSTDFFEIWHDGSSFPNWFFCFLMLFTNIVGLAVILEKLIFRPPYWPPFWKKLSKISDNLTRYQVNLNVLKYPIKSFLAITFRFDGFFPYLSPSINEMRPNSLKSFTLQVSYAENRIAKLPIVCSRAHQKVWPLITGFSSPSTNRYFKIFKKSP